MEPEILELSRETRSSIEVSRNAKGEYAWKLKLYLEDGAEGDALDRLSRIDDELRVRFLSAEE